MAVIAGDSVAIHFLGRCFGQRTVLTNTYRCTVGNAGLTTAQVLNELLNEVVLAGGANEILGQYRACLPPQWSLEETRAQVLAPVRSAFTSQGFVGFPGTNANAATVASDAAAITRRTALAGRRQISTLKIGPVPDAASAAGLLTGAYGLLLQTLGTATIKPLLLPISTCQFIPTILTALGTHDGRDLTNFFIGTTSRVNRRRTVGVGE